jgi:zinc transport system ATP-binding protein
MKNVLEIKNLSFSYSGSNVIDNLSLTIERGSFIALAGPNGAGKTTLAKLILSLEKSNSGIIKIFGESDKKNIAWHKIGYLAQRANLFNPLFPAEVREVVALGLLSTKKYPKKINRDDVKKINEILDTLGILDLKNKSVNELSGGQQQRVFLARALVNNPELLILDEPSTALDPETRASFFSLIKKLNQEKGITIILITHDTAQAGQYADQLLYLDKKIIFFGLFTDFCHSRDMEKYFGHFAQHLICHQH